MTVIYLALPLPTGSSNLPGNAARHRLTAEAAVFPYLVLLRVGFSSISIHTETWCALTAPFHPCLWLRLVGAHWRSCLCGTIRRLATPGRYPAPCLSGVRTFLPDYLPRRPSSALDPYPVYGERFTILQSAPAVSHPLRPLSTPTSATHPAVR